MPVPGPTLVLERGKPVAITIVNHAKEHASIHWHGIELESYPDGVPGGVAAGKHILPRSPQAIRSRCDGPRRVPARSCITRISTKRQQISAGLYGPIIVLEPGQTLRSRARSRVSSSERPGPTTNVVLRSICALRMNGQEQPEAMELRAGTTYRFRLLNLADDGPTARVTACGTTPVMWKAVAKDGAALPPWQATSRAGHSCSIRARSTTSS